MVQAKSPSDPENPNRLLPDVAEPVREPLNPYGYNAGSPSDPPKTPR